MIKNERVVVAMSGGVDSSVAAYLLKNQGYEVIGISLKLWDGEGLSHKVGRTCCSFEDIRDASLVCSKLEIPFYSFNYSENFREKVVDRFAEEYFAGRTPNPCVLCNHHVKFDQLFYEAKKLGASYLATGHYARIEKNEEGNFKLLKGIDASKDQSYVLFQLGQEHLSRLLFPVGMYTKAEIRKIAEENGLPTADKAESQDICFIPNRDHADFLEKHFKEKIPGIGNFIDRSGKILGAHKGYHAYTVGQRRGLGIGFGTRTYVVEIKPKTNEVVLGIASDLLSQGLLAIDVSWVSNLSFSEPIHCGVKIRYQKTEIPAQIFYDQKTRQAHVNFNQPSGAVAPGQAVVFYQGDQVLGGGFITRAQYEI